MKTFRFNEEYLSQIPALQLLGNLGYKILTPKKCLDLRGGDYGNVILDGVLRESLKKINKINHKGKEFLFSESNIQEAIEKIKNYNQINTWENKIKVLFDSINNN